ncbi:MAG: RsmB/NOP family class I SAM-dependent RNA methyltransferase [Alphaproteobacteria bacterium]|nr:MAG: RsmB/NOP family class I SAM-dependent RNA methyltransferase [Alphaproteobacteria bacterium]
MTPAARVQAAIELLDAILDSARQAGPAADTIVTRYFKERRYAGSKDRRAVRELVYRAIRRSGDRPRSGRAAMLGVAGEDEALAALFDGSAHGPGAIEEGEDRAPWGPAPEWLRTRFDPLLDDVEVAALLERAPLDLRVNTLKGSVEEAAEAFPGAVSTVLSPVGLRLPEAVQVEENPAFARGLVEVQDEGSQLIALACGARPGQLVIDLCAGGGGKTLALGAEMANEGRLIASDADRGRLSRLPPRLGRSGLTIVETRLINPGREVDDLHAFRTEADVVLVDAPCSGTGTWRRNPETRWRLTPERLQRLLKTQAHLLDVATEFLKPGGVLVYAVCSLLKEEGRDQAEALAKRCSALVWEDVPISGGRAAGPGRLLSPAHDGTDGFFIARWRAPC